MPYETRKALKVMAPFHVVHDLDRGGKRAVDGGDVTGNPSMVTV